MPYNFREKKEYPQAVFLGGTEFWWLLDSFHHTVAVSLQCSMEIVAVPAFWNGEQDAHFLVEEVGDTGTHRWIEWLDALKTWTNCYDSTDVSQLSEDFYSALRLVDIEILGGENNNLYFKIVIHL